ncbi:hypothetical protein [Idiomarina seosinensis]|uniref:hypothetical protein n=1 Tax=Idiomarina seosinensis TaxID=281739 RepID=UPI000F86B33E|nr:hypothetical protein [Idiomarina seosinensis]
MQVQWRSQQQAVLQAMQVPLYQARQKTAPTSAPENDDFFYRIGPLYLSSAQPLPVALPRWLEDLCIVLDSRPVAVKEATTEAGVWTLQQCHQQLQNAQGKRQFWQQLSNVLMSR